MAANLHNRTIAVEMTDLMLSVILKGMAFEKLDDNQLMQVDVIMEKALELKDRVKKLEAELKNGS